MRQLINITLTKDPEGLGIKLAYERGKLVITRFQSLPRGRKGPAEDCGLLCPGDALIAVDGETLTGFLFSQAINKIKAAPVTFSMCFSRVISDDFLHRNFDVEVPMEYAALANQISVNEAADACFCQLTKDDNGAVCRQEIVVTKFGDAFHELMQYVQGQWRAIMTAEVGCCRRTFSSSSRPLRAFGFG